MFVAIVTAPSRPAWEIVSPSRWACSGFAFRTTWSIPLRLNSAPSISETSTEIVPIRIGWPSSLRSLISRTSAFHLPSFVL